MDQFRGFTVISMFLVNFVHHMDNMHPIWKHNDNYFSFADWIMPGFIFAVGFSYRLTVLKRLQQFGPWKTYFTYFRRSIALIVVSLMLYGWGGGFKEWAHFSEGVKKGDRYTNEIHVEDSSGEFEVVKVNPTRQFVMRLIKSNLWEVLAIIGVCQIFIMPVVAAGWLVRFLSMVACAVAHVVISGIFNWGFVHGYEHNDVVQLWQTGTNRSWDGGFFGIISWSIAMLAGTLAHDIMVKSPRRTSAGGRIFCFAVTFMVIGYGLSCLSRLYDIPLESETTAEAADSPQEKEEKKPGDIGENVPREAGDLVKYSKSPMRPQIDKASGRSIVDLLAEPPFVMPPHFDPAQQLQHNENLKRREELSASANELSEEEAEELSELNTKLLGVRHYQYARQWNYWMMYKRMVSVPFILFSTGFAIALFALFIVFTDLCGLHVGVFRTFGMNPLAAYVFHSMIGHSLESFTPDDAPHWYCWVITGVFIGITYLFVRHLEKHNIYIRL